MAEKQEVALENLAVPINPLPPKLCTVSLHDFQANTAQKFPSNYIRTAKYTILTFLPKNLWEQFRRVSNLYFLLNAIISLIPSVTPVSPVTTVAPLVFVLAVTAVKDALEDYQRHKADKKSNSAEYPVSRRNERGETQVVVVQSAHIVVGDIVHVTKEREFPADLVLLGTSGAEGVCYVETANLDGETNLKRRCTTAPMAHLRTAEELHHLTGQLRCEPSTVDLYKFVGSLELLGQEPMALSQNQLLLRGAVLRNTKEAYGLVVYAGEESKMMRNLKLSSSKFSRAQKRLNRIVACVFCLDFLIVVTAGILGGVFQWKYTSLAAYMGSFQWDNPVKVGALGVVTQYVLFTYLIPISLFVTVEVVRVIQALFMQWDKTMASDPDDVAGTGMKARNSNMNEELGGVEHIFSDKTGTLTRNVMALALWSINGVAFDHRQDPTSVLNARSMGGVPAAKITDFLRALALCNTVVPERDERTGIIAYEAESPDEAALVDAAGQCGVVLVGRHGRRVVLEVDHQQEDYELLATCEFSSDRKRMSVVMKYPNGAVWLLCKGADNKVLELTRPDDPLRPATVEHLYVAAKEGLRTLMISCRPVEPLALDLWLLEYERALSAFVDREEKVDALQTDFEMGVEILGCTGVEDRLQDKVPETLQYLLDAGIYVWVLTGDKQETAENIGYSSKLLPPTTDLIRVIADSAATLSSLLDSHLQRLSVEPPGAVADHSVIIDGPTLTFALADVPDKFLELAQRCQSVICCRVTPLQKAKVVLLVKEKLGRICLAVGDGANDVSMIQQAHVGVGIKGKEGTQAVRASDYALQEFRFLAPLICVHGRYSMLQMATLIQYSFYKNIVFIFPQFLFGFLSLFSAQIVYDQIIMTTFNIVWLSLPPLAMGIFERDVGKGTIMANPRLYSEFQKPGVFTAKSMFRWLSFAFVHGTAIFCIVAFGVIGNDILYQDGQTGGFWVMATMASTCSITIILFKAALEFKLWNVFVHLSIWLSLAGYYAFLVLYMNAFIVDFNDDIYGVAVHLWISPTFWLALALCTAVVLLPDVVVRYVSEWHHPRNWNILREQSKRQKVGLLPVAECRLDAIALTAPDPRLFDMSNSGGNLNSSAFI